ncbi:Succinate dehydrogenase assembly factor 4, mitochondrial [Armadillidium vulgare]|nr:Succinate dehydrogenase assembly factor 4, mitochondrial [Armadillidium vulgare]
MAQLKNLILRNFMPMPNGYFVTSPFAKIGACYLSNDNGKNDGKNINKGKTPIGKLEPQAIEGRHPYQEKEPLQPFPDNINPETGEIGGPRGPEPTRGEYQLGIG